MRNIVEVWRQHARRGERMGEWIERIGWERFFALTGIPFSEKLINHFIFSREERPDDSGIQVLQRISQVSTKYWGFARGEYNLHDLRSLCPSWLLFWWGWFMVPAVWLNVPVPFKLTLFPAPATTEGAVLDEVWEAVGFRSLWRGNKGLWLGAWVFHLSLAFVLIGHFVGIMSIGKEFMPFGASATNSEHLFGTVRHLYRRCFTAGAGVFNLAPCWLSVDAVHLHGRGLPRLILLGASPAAVCTCACLPVCRWSTSTITWVGS